MHANDDPTHTYDTSILFVSAFNFDKKADCDRATLQPCSDYVLSTIKLIVDNFKGLYPINSGCPEKQACAIGLWVGDTTLGGQVCHLPRLYSLTDDQLMTGPAIHILEKRPVNTRQEIDREVRS